VNRLALLHRSDHTRLQASFGNLHIPMQAIDQIYQQTLFLQLSRTDSPLQGDIALRVTQDQLTITIGIGGGKVSLVRGQSIIEQSANSFHPAHSLVFWLYGY